MIAWEDWNDEKMRKDSRFKLIFMKRFGQENSHYMEKEVFGRRGMESYSNMYMPVAIDVDERPEIFMKYGMNHTPLVIITTPDGRVLARGGVTDYTSFIKFMVEIGVLINRERDTLERFSAEDLSEDEDGDVFQGSLASFRDGLKNLVDRFIDEVIRSSIRDSRLLLQMLEYTLTNGDIERTEKIVGILEKNEDGAEGGLFCGGSVNNPFVFSTMKESHMNMKYARLLMEFSRISSDGGYEERANRILKFLESMKDDCKLYFRAISEDSEYYRLPKEARSARGKPALDRRIFFDVNAGMVEELCRIGRIDEAEAVMEKLEEMLTDRTKERIHRVYHSGSKLALNTVSDIASGVSAYSALYRVTGKTRYKDRIFEMLSLIERKKGKMLFFEYDESGFGFVRKKKVDVVGNIKIVRSLEAIGIRAEDLRFSLIRFIEPNVSHAIEWLI